MSQWAAQADYGPPHMTLALLEAVEMGLLRVVQDLHGFVGVVPPPTEKSPATILDRKYLYQDWRPKTALEKALFYGYDTVARLLIEHAANQEVPAEPFSSSPVNTKDENLDQAASDTTESDEADETSYDDSDPWKVIKYAVAPDNVEVLKAYMLQYPQPEDRIKELNHLLHYAAENGKLNAIRFCLTNGAFIESESYEFGCTSLAIAVSYGQSDAVSRLIEAGADMSVEVGPMEDVEDETTRTLLQEAVTSQKIFEHRRDFLFDSFLLHFSSDVIKDDDIARLDWHLRGRLAAHSRPSELIRDPDFLKLFRQDAAHEKIIHTLLDHGADISVLGANGETLLHSSVISRSRVTALLEHQGPSSDSSLDIDGRDKDGRTPLHYAAAACNHDLMQLLIEKGADIFASDNLGVTLLYFAVLSSRCVEVAVREGCNIHETHKQLGTPLQFAKSTESSSLRTIEMLGGNSEAAGETKAPQTQSSDDNMVLLDTESTAYRETVYWLEKMQDKHNILCSTRIKYWLDNSNQQGLVLELEKEASEMKKKEHAWVLVVPREHEGVINIPEWLKWEHEA